MTTPFIHPREEWEVPGNTITGPAPKSTPGTWVIHYPGSPSSWKAPMTDAENISSLRAANLSYLNSRGYAYGYGVVVSQSGSAWEVRGTPASRTRYNNAANAGKKTSGNFNNVSVAIQIAVSGNDPASPAAVAMANSIIATQPTWNVIIHGDVDWTSCCGAGVIAQVRAGVIGQQKANAPAPVVVPPVASTRPPIEYYNPPTNWGLFAIDGSKNTVKVGDSGELVSYLQDVIFFYGGGDIVRDGVFGPATAARVVALQKMFKLTQDEVVGPVTWGVIDYLVALNVVPVVTAPPPPSGVTSVKSCKWYLNKGDTPWGVAYAVYGSGASYTKLDSKAFSSYSVPSQAVLVECPGIAGKTTTVESGEGPWAIMRRMGANPSQAQETFYKWNGGWERNFQPGDIVHLPEVI